MKRFILALSTALAMFASNAQPAPVMVFPKTIQVTGIAELNIAPDEIHVLITLKEYEKKGKGKVEIARIKNAFLGYLHNISIPDSSIKIASLDGSSSFPWWRKKQQKDELYASVTYEITFRDTKKIDEVIDLLDDEATQNFIVSEITHTNLVALQRQLRIDAIKAAKAKAVYLAESISETVGSAVTISETTFPQVFDNMKRYANSMSINETGSVDFARPEFKKINLKAEMNVVFELR